MAWAAFGAWQRVSGSLFGVLVRSDSALNRCFFYRVPRGAVLDMLFGPEQHFEYESTTTP